MEDQEANVKEWYDHQANPLLVVISGPSGAGKDTALDGLQALGYPCHRVITATTRAPRANEAHGRDYFFYATSEFEKMIADDELLEHAQVYGDYKGVPKQQVRDALAEGMDVIVRVDVQGAATIRRIVPEAVFVFIRAESEEALVKRLTERGSGETQEQLETRITKAREEMACIPEFDYVIVNESGRQEEVGRKLACIIEAEKSRVRQRRITL